MRRFLAILALLGALAPAPRASAQGIDDLAAALRLPELLQIVRDEGLANAADILPRTPSGEVPAPVLEAARGIFAVEAMQADMRLALAAHLDAAAMAEAATFFGGETGRQLVHLELSARRAIMEPDIEEVARANWMARQNDRDPQITAIRRFARANDLVARNAASAMVARYEFLHGLAAGQGQILDEDAALRDVWAQEEAILEDTESWMMGFLLLAYGPLETAQIEAYTEFSLQPAGEALNQALFAGFEASYRRISYELGRITGQALGASDL